MNINPKIIHRKRNWFHLLKRIPMGLTQKKEEKKKKEKKITPKGGGCR